MSTTDVSASQGWHPVVTDAVLDLSTVEKSVPAMVRATTERYPDAPALLDDGAVSYEQLEARSNGVASAVIDRIGAGSRFVRKKRERQKFALLSLRRRMVRRYKAEAYPGTVLLAHAVVVEPKIDDRWDLPDLGWAPYVSGELIIVDVPGSHGTVIERHHARTTAAALEQALAPFEAAARSGAMRREPADGATT